MTKPTGEGTVVELTEYVTTWVTDLRLEDVPASVKRTALEHLLDGYALAVSGVVEQSHQILCEHIGAAGGADEAYVFGTGLRVPAESAALVNGASMHAMDYDDTQLSTNPESVYGLLTHPTSPVLAAAAAAADIQGASGADLLVAYIAGVEVACRLADAMYSRHYRDGFHSSGTVGTFGAVAAAGKVLGLSAEELRRAFGIAGGVAGGLRENFGTMAKPLHVGNAARGGLLAARLAARGFTAAKSIIEAPRGFMNAAAGGYEPSRVDGRLGAPFYFADPGISVKPYPSGSLSHPGQYAAIELVREHDVQPEDVVRAVAATNSAMPSALIYALPQTALEAKFSFPFFLAIAILRRRAGIAEFADEVVTSGEVQEMMKRCEHIVDAEIDARGFEHLETRIELHLRDGRVLDRTASYALGHPRMPMSQDQLEAKFAECASLALPSERIERAISAIWNLESLADLTILHGLLSTIDAAERPSHVTHHQAASHR